MIRYLEANIIQAYQFVLIIWMVRSWLIVARECMKIMWETIRLTGWCKALCLCLMLYDNESFSMDPWVLKELPDEKKGKIAFSLHKNEIYVADKGSTGLTQLVDDTIITLNTGHSYILTLAHQQLASMEFGFPVYHEFYFGSYPNIYATDYMRHSVGILNEIARLEKKLEEKEKELKEKEKKSEQEKKELENNQLELSLELNDAYNSLEQNIDKLKINLQQQIDKAKSLKEKLSAEVEKGKIGRARSIENAKKKKAEELRRERSRAEKIRQLEAENIDLAAKLDERGQSQNEVEMLKAEVSKLKKQLKSIKKGAESSGSDSRSGESKIDSSAESRQYNLLKQRSTEKLKATMEPTVLNLRPAVTTVCDEGNPGYVEMETIKRYEKGEDSTMADPARKWVKDTASSVKNAAVARWPFLMKLGCRVSLMSLSAGGMYWIIANYLVNSLENEKQIYRKIDVQNMKQGTEFVSGIKPKKDFEIDYGPVPIGHFTGDPEPIVYFSKVVYPQSQPVYPAIIHWVNLIDDCGLIDVDILDQLCMFFYLKEELRLSTFVLLLDFYRRVYNSKKYSVIHSRNSGGWNSISEWYYGNHRDYIQPVYYGSFLINSNIIEKLFASQWAAGFYGLRQTALMAAAYLYCQVADEPEANGFLEKCIKCLLDIHLNSRNFIAGYSQIEVILEDMRPLPYSFKGFFLFLRGIYQYSEDSSLKFDHFKPTLFTHGGNEFTVFYQHSCKKEVPVLFSGFPDREYDLLTYDKPGLRWDAIKHLNLSAVASTDPILHLCDGSYWLMPKSSEDSHFYFVIYKGKVYQYKPLGRMMEH